MILGLRTKILALVGGGLLLATLGIAYLAHSGIEEIIDRSQSAVYQGQLDHLTQTLAQYQDELEKTLQVNAYRDQFQEEALRIIRLNYLLDADENAYPFILDHRGTVLLHPSLPYQDETLSKQDFVQPLLHTASGHFKYRYLGEDKWMIYARFEPWDWIVGYSLKQSYMYADLTHFRKTLLPSIVAFLVIITAILLYGLQRFLRPIIGLAQSANAIAAGNLEEPIIATGNDEVGILARNFEAMRTSIEQKITALNLQQKQLEEEVKIRRRTEDELITYRDKLEVLVEERTHELKETHAALVQSERLGTLGKLTATVSHELRNPLGTIQAALFSIEDSLRRKVPNQTERSIELAERNIARCVNIIEELNNYARVKALDISEASLDDWLRAVVNEQSLPMGVFCELDLACGVSVMFDQEKLRQVIVNLINNAVHALQEKQSNERNLHISSRLLLNDNYEIRIIDNGAGMSEEIKEKVFEPLFSTKGFGVGLGMVVVKNIIEQHHGEINIESEEGKGTTIILRLPVNPQE